MPFVRRAIFMFSRSAGTQRWPAVHAADAARGIVEVIGRRLEVPVASVAVEEFGPLGHIFIADQAASSAITRRELGRVSTHPNLIDDLGNIRP